MTTDFRYEPTWASLQNYEVPQWFMDEKLGIFIHWGVYSVPAFDNEWYPRFMYRDEVSRKGPNYFEHHTETWGYPSKFGYKDFIPLFKAENWDRHSGSNCSARRARATSCRWLSIMTASRCSRARIRAGTRLRWARSGMCARS